MTDIKEIVDSEVERIKEKEDVLAVGIVGSYARDPEGDHNDIDIYVIIDGNWRKRFNKEIDGILFEEFYNSKKWAKSYFDREKDSYYMFHWMQNIDIRYDPENVFPEIIEFSENKAEEILDLTEEEKEMITYTIWDYEQDIGQEDIGQRRHSMNQFFDYLIKQNYILNGEIPVKNNYRISKMQEFDGYMYKLAQDYLTSSSTLERKMKLEKMSEHVKRKLPDQSLEFEIGKEEFPE